MFEIMIEDTFASAHQLIGYEGPCENLHGHTWKVQVFLSGEKLNETGMLYDFKGAKKILKDILMEFDHKNLNEVRYFIKANPTAENIAKTIFGLFNDKIKGAGLVHEPAGHMPKLTKITVWESERTCATYTS